jgi:hypothetical protein
MTKKDFFISELYNSSYSVNDIVNIYYDKCETMVEEKRKYYILKDKEKTEKQLRSQLYAEFCREYTRNIKFYIKDANKVYSLTDEGKTYYENNYTETNNIEDDEIGVDDEIEKSIDDDTDINFGIIYLLKSKMFNDIYK